MKKNTQWLGLAVLAIAITACQDSSIDHTLGPKIPSSKYDYTIPQDGVVYPSDASVTTDDGSLGPVNEAIDPGLARHCPGTLKGNPTGLQLTLQTELFVHETKTIGIPPYTHMQEYWYYVGTYLRSDGVTERFNCATFQNYES